MSRKRDFFHTGLNVSRSDLAGLPFGANPTGAQDYFVDGNVKVSEDGEHWNSPVKSLSEAIALSNISIKSGVNRWWARRNRIFCCGDQELTENLTVFPEKCDIIGVGFDIEPMPRITGDHTLVSGSGNGKAYGTRLINLGFMGGSTGETLHFATDHMGVEFHGCKFWPNVAGSTHCIRLADNNRAFKMFDCQIYEHAGAIGTGIYAEGIKIEGVGQHDMEIKDSYIRATEGIHIVAATAGYNSHVDNCVISAAAITINDAASLLKITNSCLISDADGNTITAAIVANANLCAKVWVTHSGTDEAEWFPQVQAD
jgi:hypothetical protein